MKIEIKTIREDGSIIVEETIDNIQNFINSNTSHQVNQILIDSEHIIVEERLEKEELKKHHKRCEG